MASPQYQQSGQVHPSVPGDFRPGDPPWALPAAVAFLILVTSLVYANAFGGPFLFDDEGSIVNNPTIRSLTDLGSLLSPPPGETVGGRPVLNLTFAINYALGGVRVWGYHLVNLLIHLAAGLTLFGVVRRTLLGAAGQVAPGTSVWQRDALPIAMVSALLFLVHPLQTESVSYLVQRAESLVSLWYLLTLYAFIRGVTSSHPTRWVVAGIVSCALGMGSKEVMAGAPLVVLLYDRTFVAGSFGRAWRARTHWYLGLGATWIILAVLVLSQGRGTSAGWSSGISPWNYLLTQVHAVVHYVRLVFWPAPLVFDYGTGVEDSLRSVLGWILAIAVVKLVILWALYQRYALGFVGAAVLLVLAPSTSFIPIATQTVAEHRMYLALGGVLIAVVVALYHWMGRWAILLGLIWAAVLSLLTVQRNLVYQSERTLWETTVAARPSNPRAHRNLARLMIRAGESAPALAHLRVAVQLDSSYAVAQNDLGMLLGKAGQYREARDHLAAAVRFQPDLVEARFNYGSMLAATGEVDRALAEFEEVARRDASFPRLQLTMGQVLAGAGRPADAAAKFRLLVQQFPDSANFALTLGSLLVLSEQWEEAVTTLEGVVKRAPQAAIAHSELGQAYRGLGRRVEAEQEFTAALRLDPTLRSAREGIAKLKQRE